MKMRLSLLCFFAVPALLAAPPVKLVMCQVKNLDYKAKHFEGCEIQRIVINADESCWVQGSREGKPVFYGLRAHWEGDDIKISFSSAVKEGGKFKAVETKEAVLKQMQPKEFVVSDITYLVSA